MPWVVQKNSERQKKVTLSVSEIPFQGNRKKFRVGLSGRNNADSGLFTKIVWAILGTLSSISRRIGMFFLKGPLFSKPTLKFGVFWYQMCRSHGREVCEVRLSSHCARPQNFRAEIRKFLGVQWIATCPNGLVPFPSQNEFRARMLDYSVSRIRVRWRFRRWYKWYCVSCFMCSNLTSIKRYLEQTVPSYLPYEFQKWRKEHSKFSRKINLRKSGPPRKVERLFRLDGTDPLIQF